MRLLLFLHSTKQIKNEYLGILEDIVRVVPPNIKELPIPGDRTKNRHFEDFQSLFKDQKESDYFYDLAKHFQKRIESIQNKCNSLNVEYYHNSFSVEPTKPYSATPFGWSIDIDKVRSILERETSILTYTFENLYPSVNDANRHLKSIESINDKKFSLSVKSFTHSDGEIPHFVEKLDIEYYFPSREGTLFREIELKTMQWPIRIHTDITHTPIRVAEHPYFSINFLKFLILGDDVIIVYFVENFFRTFVDRYCPNSTIPIY